MTCPDCDKCPVCGGDMISILGKCLPGGGIVRCKDCGYERRLK